MILGMFCALACALAPGQVGIGPDHDQFGGTIVRENLPLFGVREVARYVDNEEPDRATITIREQAAGWKVIAGLAQGRPEPLPGAINALEWYPFWGGREYFGPPPAFGAYILQRGFTWDGVPLTGAQVALLTRQAQRHRPQLILYYDGKVGK